MVAAITGWCVFCRCCDWLRLIGWSRSPPPRVGRISNQYLSEQAVMGVANFSRFTDVHAVLTTVLHTSSKIKWVLV